MAAKTLFVISRAAPTASVLAANAPAPRRLAYELPRDSDELHTVHPVTGSRRTTQEASDWARLSFAERRGRSSGSHDFSRACVASWATG